MELKHGDLRNKGFGKGGNKERHRERRWRKRGRRGYLGVEEIHKIIGIGREMKREKFSLDI